VTAVGSRGFSTSCASRSTTTCWSQAALLGDRLEERRQQLRATLPIGRVVGPTTSPRSPSI
jgi:hypothetical protein